MTMILLYFVTDRTLWLFLFYITAKSEGKNEVDQFNV